MNSFMSRLKKVTSGGKPSSESKYVIKKQLGDEGLEKLLFDKTNGTKILKKLDLEPVNIENKTWSFPIDVVDDDTKKKYTLVLSQKEKGGPFGFYEDWKKIVKDKKLEGNAEIGLYVDSKTDEVHFSLLNTQDNNE
ncbi:DNA-binding pseudobarrel domain superfamily [Forsythia ovata]|uniref:DNA-binding pseudobarrel domain superfamily n=1 Tax=Forsythia ovata TaxID=205694 RepID=A0ABD1U695_9LAMI